MMTAGPTTGFNEAGAMMPRKSRTPAGRPSGPTRSSRFNEAGAMMPGKSRMSPSGLSSPSAPRFNEAGAMMPRKRLECLRFGRHSPGPLQ